MSYVISRLEIVRIGRESKRTWICLEKKQVNLGPQLIRIRSLEFIKLIEAIINAEFVREKKVKPSFRRGKI